jgi:uncharacterized phage protein (TIGR02220 family)
MKKATIVNPDVSEVINHLNLTTGTTCFLSTYPQNVRLVTAIIEAGYTVDDMKRVIDKKWKSWRGTKFEQYMRPSTLFGEKFENYLNEQRDSKGTPIQRLSGAVEAAKLANWRLDKKRK